MKKTAGKKHKPYVIYTSPCYGFNIMECLTKKAYRALGYKELSPLYGYGVGLANGKKIFKITIKEC